MKKQFTLFFIPLLALVFVGCGESGGSFKIPDDYGNECNATRYSNYTHMRNLLEDNYFTTVINGDNCSYKFDFIFPEYSTSVVNTGIRSCDGDSNLTSDFQFKITSVGMVDIFKPSSVEGNITARCDREEDELFYFLEDPERLKKLTKIEK